MALYGIFADLSAEGEALDRLVGGLSAAEWDLPTPAPGWTIRHQIGHISSTARVAFAAATDPAALASRFSGPRPDFDAALVALLQDYLTVPPDELLGRWRTERDAAAGALAGFPADALLPWLTRPMPAWLLAAAGLQELFAHGQDIADALGIEREYTDRIRPLTAFAESNRDYGYEVRGLTPPGFPFRFELTAPSGDVWVSGPADAPERVTGPAVDFFLLVTRRRHRDDVAVTASGPETSRWLDIAQSYRGAPGPGRVPGQFPRDKARHGMRSGPAAA